MLKKIFWLFLILMIVDMAVIFMFSSQNAEKSSQVSKSIVETVVEKIIEKVDKTNKVEVKPESLEKIIRKSAHFALFALLGVFAFFMLKTSGYIRKNMYIFAFTLLICIVYAISDEVHQLFVSGRDGNVADVVIDTSGALIGMSIAYLLSRVRFSK